MLLNQPNAEIAQLLKEIIMEMDHEKQDNSGPSLDKILLSLKPIKAQGASSASTKKRPLENALAMNKQGKLFAVPKAPEIVKCSDCDEAFFENKELVAHIKDFHPKRPYRCNYPGCNKSFSSQNDLKEHDDSIHQGIKYSCAQCNKTFIQKRSLTRHIAKIHARY